MSKYPAVITDELLEQNKHISDETIQADIEDTLAEISAKEAEVEHQEKLLKTPLDQGRRRMAGFRLDGARDGIRRRKEFIEYLERLLSARHDTDD